MSRIASVDTIRLFAIIAIVALHTTPFEVKNIESNTVYHYLDIAINQLARFAVPFFFSISGYFFGLKVNSGVDAITLAFKNAKRILMLFLMWSLIYLTPYNVMAFAEFGVLGPFKVAYWNLTSLISEPITFLFQGSKVHLWFLVSLIISIILSACFLKYGKKKITDIFRNLIIYIRSSRKSIRFNTYWYRT